MVALCIVMGLMIIIESIVLVVSIRKMIELGIIVLEIESVIEKSLDELDACHRELDHALTIPVQFDDPVTRNIIKMIVNAKLTIHTIAIRLHESMSERKEQNDDE